MVNVLYLVKSGLPMASNEVFGDPLPGVVKECRFKGRMEQFVQ